MTYCCQLNVLFILLLVSGTIVHIAGSCIVFVTNYKCYSNLQDMTKLERPDWSAAYRW